MPQYDFDQIIENPLKLMKTAFLLGTRDRLGQAAIIDGQPNLESNIHLG